MVSSIGSNSSQNTVAQALQQQNERVDVQREQQAQQQNRQEQVRAQESASAEQRQSNADDRRGRSVDVSV